MHLRSKLGNKGEKERLPILINKEHRFHEILAAILVVLWYIAANFCVLSLSYVTSIPPAPEVSNGRTLAEASFFLGTHYIGASMQAIIREKRALRLKVTYAWTFGKRWTVGYARI